MECVLTPGKPAPQSQEYLAFRLGSEEYGVDILAVQELRSYGTLTRIANAPAYIKGVMNLRGIVVPVLDLRLRLCAGNASYDQFTVVIVLSVGGREVGMVVDSVADVISFQSEHIKPPPPVGDFLVHRRFQHMDIRHAHVIFYCEHLPCNKNVASTIPSRFRSHRCPTAIAYRTLARWCFRRANSWDKVLCYWNASFASRWMERRRLTKSSIRSRTLVSVPRNNWRRPVAAFSTELSCFSLD
ncbi:MAG: chemotaxis protein CheW [Burkholderiaceae bacterium]|nr:chemotaxis protein CheW [Burkholderiaceae bacterium]